VIQESHDPYLAAEAVTALARIGEPAGLAVVDRIAREGPARRRAAARAARLPTGCWSRLELRDDRWSAAVVGAVHGDGARPDQHPTGHW